MTTRDITQIVPAREITEGAGVRVFRSLGTPARRNLDPFLMLDQFSTDDPSDYVAGFPDHPHRGFNTFTYMLDGRMRHADSMGNRGDLGPGGAQWMKAGSGVIHSEMPQQTSGRMRGFQLWINLPAKQKMTAPEYQDISTGSIPEVEAPGASVRILAGRLGDQKGPVADPNTDFRFFDLSLRARADYNQTLPEQHTAFLYLFEGTANVGDSLLEERQLAVLGKGERLTLCAGPNGARLLLVAGKAIGEPIEQHGPFVMNTREEIEQALADYRDGRLVRGKASMIDR